MMRAGTDTGSLINHLMSRQVRGEPPPEKGMGATLLSWTDRHAATIVDVFTAGRKTIVKVQEDKSIRIDKNGFSESQDYRYEENPQGRTYHFAKDSKGFWVQMYYNEDTRRWSQNRCYGLKIGVRDSYHDYSF